MRKDDSIHCFTVLGTPRPKSRPRFVKGRVVSSVDKNEKIWRRLVESEVARLSHDAPIDYPVAIDMEFWFATKDPDRVGRPHAQRPDKDNLEKLVLDVLTKKGVIKDDALVVTGRTAKMWAMMSGVDVAIYPA